MSLDKLHEIIGIHGDSGNWDYDEYMHGMYNGLELARAIIENNDPDYREVPDQWGREAREQALRKDNPTLQRAWDEYEILKKLIEET